MRQWLLAAAIALSVMLPATSFARPCVHRCKDRGRLCRARCKAAAPGYRQRRDCTKSCKLRELECRANCP